MRIDSNLPANLMIESSRTAKGVKSVAGDQGAEGRADQASLSTDRSTVQSLESEVALVPDIREEKVQALRSAIKDGSYRVNPEQIAAAMYRDLMPGNMS